jgi:RHS repeat-associated protein
MNNNGVTLDDALTWDAFGNLVSESNSPNGDRYGYTGRERDLETALQYNRARYYDPATGRWMTQDPLGFDAGDSNLYRYVSNAPNLFSDPAGTDEFQDRIAAQKDGRAGYNKGGFSYDKRDFNVIKDIRAISDGFGSGGIIVRKDNPLKNPEVNGFKPTNPKGATTIGQHVLGEGLHDSPYISGSSNPRGSPNHTGTRYYIDVRRFEQAGGRVIRSNEILADLNRMVGQDAGYVHRVQMWKKAGELEVLLQGNVPASAVRGPAAMALTKGVKALSVWGKITTVWDIGNAGKESLDKGSFTPLGKELVRQAGSWGGAWAGAKMGAQIGFMIGIEGGPLAVVTTAVGGILGGLIGFFVGNQLADSISSETHHNIKGLAPFGLRPEDSMTGK